MTSEMSGKRTGQAIASLMRNEAATQSRIVRAKVTDISERVTDGRIKCQIPATAQTVYVDAAGSLELLAVNDWVWIRKMDAGWRDMWIIVQFDRTSAGSHVPTVRSDAIALDHLDASDGTPAPAWNCDALGRLVPQSNTYLLMSGVPGAVTLDADGDSAIDATTDDQIDVKLSAATTASFSVTGLALVSGDDIFPQADGGGLFQRGVNHWISPDDHFNAFSGWTWSTAGVHDGAPTAAEVATYPSLLRLRNDDVAEDHFAYKSGEVTNMYCRLTKGVSSYVGIRLDDGDDTDYIELRLVDSATAGFFRLDFIENTGGVGANTTSAADGLPIAFYVLRLLRTTGAGWAIYAYYVKDSPVPVYTGQTLAALNWTPTRYGIIFGQRGVASSEDRIGLVDWIEYTTV